MNSSQKQRSDVVDAVVVGAGFAGLHALYRLREMGLSTRGFEAGSSVGGTWYWNRYPGARTDSTYEVYQFWFSPEILEEWNWSERFPPQAETERYLNFVADRLKIREMIDFNTRIESAHWNESEQTWHVTSDQGETVHCRYLLCCTGLLSEPKLPPFEGVASFNGQVIHTSRWPKQGLDLRGKRVGVIGTGATGIQVIQTIASQVKALFVFQRTPSWAIPMKNFPLSQAQQQQTRADYDNIRKKTKTSLTGHHYDCQSKPWAQTTPEERRQVYEQGWADGSLQLFCKNYVEFLMDETANQEVTDFIVKKMQARIDNPKLAAKLIPSDHGFGTRRPPLDTGYLEVYARDNVQLIDVCETPINGFSEHGIVVGDTEYGLDIVIMATGFNAATGAINRIDVRGRNKRSLKAQWDTDITTAMGMQKHGFPNFFMTAAPLSPGAAFCNVPTCVQQQVEWIADCIAHVERNGQDKVVEATQQFEDEWVKHHDELTQPSLIYKVDSWWTGANVEGKPRRVLSYIGAGAYREKCDEVAANGYEGFTVR
ncbi:MAG: flavin-containing monooxygenase [Panacagrimonas sp.]